MLVLLWPVGIVAEGELKVPFVSGTFIGDYPSFDSCSR